MTLELPELLEIEWDNYADKINNIYDIYLNEIYGKLSFFGKPVHCRIIPIYDNKHECFWHLMTQDFEKRKTNGERFPDLNRCRRIHWIAKIITNYQSSDIVCWVKQHRRKVSRKSLVEDRIYLWAKSIILLLSWESKRNPKDINSLLLIVLMTQILFVALKNSLVNIQTQEKYRDLKK